MNERKANVTNTVHHDGENIDYSSLQHHNGPDCITKSDTPRFLSNSKHSPSEGKLNSVNQPSNIYYPFHSPFHMLHSPSTNGILDQTINTLIDRTTLDLASEILKKTPTVDNTAQMIEKTLITR